MCYQLYVPKIPNYTSQSVTTPNSKCYKRKKEVLHKRVIVTLEKGSIREVNVLQSHNTFFYVK
jgi:hypothetical protein